MAKIKIEDYIKTASDVEIRNIKEKAPPINFRNDIDCSKHQIQFFEIKKSLKLKSRDSRLLRAILANFVLRKQSYLQVSLDADFYDQFQNLYNGYSLNSKKVRKLLFALEENGFINIFEGSQKYSLRARIKATSRLLLLLKSIKIGDINFNQYSVELKNNEKIVIKFDQKNKIDLIKDVKLINKYCSQFNYSYLGENICGWDYKRVFNNSSYQVGGRLYGTLQSTQRIHRHTLTINGEKIIGLDFKNLHINFLYIQLTKKCFEGDAYMIEGFDRSVIKNVVNIMINCKSLQEAYGAIRNKSIVKGKGNLKKIVNAIFEKHHVVKNEFLKDCDGASLGAKFQFLDSELLIAIVKRIISLNKNIPLMLMHDGIDTTEPYIQTVKQVMEEEAALKGYPLVVDIKHY